VVIAAATVPRASTTATATSSRSTARMPLVSLRLSRHGTTAAAPAQQTWAAAVSRVVHQQSIVACDFHKLSDKLVVISGTSTDVSADDWTASAYDDSSWPYAADGGINGVDPWGVNPDIDGTARWIWVTSPPLPSSPHPTHIFLSCLSCLSDFPQASDMMGTDEAFCRCNEDQLATVLICQHFVHSSVNFCAFLTTNR
jgi:hypothetical protein